MPLSRHFYALDEVEAALAYSTTRHDPKETLFWCKELLVSGCAAEAIRALFEAWLWQKGPFCITWILEAWERLSRDEVAEDDILWLAHHLQQRFLFRDHSLWNVLMLSRLDAEQPDRLSYRTPSWLFHLDEDETVKAFLCAIYQKKARLAWWFARQMDTTHVWRLMEEYARRERVFGEKVIPWIQICIGEYESLLGRRSDEYDEVMRCVFLLSLCMTRKQQKESMAPLVGSFNQTWDNNYVDLIGRKTYRRYKIPTQCLYAGTDRGCIPWTSHTRSQLYQIEPFLIGCPFWDDVLTTYSTGVDEKTGEIQWISYDTKEAFYDQYFPDLPPDEWTEKEIAMSHDVGLLRPGERLHLRRYAQLYFSKITRLAWNIAPRVYRLLSDAPRDQVGVTSFSELTCPMVVAESIKIKPVKRRFRY